MGCFIKLNWTSGTLRKSAFIILWIDLISSLCSLFYRQHESYFYPVDNEDGSNDTYPYYTYAYYTDAYYTDALYGYKRPYVSAPMIVNILVLDLIPSIIGLLGISKESPSFMRVYVGICRIDMARVLITILFLSLSWITYHDLTEYMMNFLVLLDSSLFLDHLDKFFHRFPETGLQVFWTCIVMLQICFIKWFSTCVVYTYYSKIEKKKMMQNDYLIAQRLTSSLMDGIDVSRKYRPELREQPEYVSPADPPPPYTV